MHTESYILPGPSDIRMHGIGGGGEVSWNFAIALQMQLEESAETVKLPIV